jgi:hypothetical protein
VQVMWEANRTGNHLRNLKLNQGDVCTQAVDVRTKCAMIVDGVS